MWQVNLPFENEKQKEFIETRIALVNHSGVWEKDDVLILYFESERDLEDFKKVGVNFSYFIEKIKEKIDWSVKWQKLHKVIRLRPFIVLPPFLNKELTTPYKYKIVINPSFAFGTGSHPTTKMCIKYLSKYVKKNDVVLDMGTGSAILSIAAEKLGAKQIIAVDIDEIALKEAKKNIKINRCKNISLSNFLSPDLIEVFDVVVCNILFNDIIKLRDTFAKVTKKKGFLILSGLLIEQKDDVIKHFSKYFEYINSMKMKDKNFQWVALLFKKI